MLSERSNGPTKIASTPGVATISSMLATASAPQRARQATRLRGIRGNRASTSRRRRDRVPRPLAGDRRGCATVSEPHAAGAVARTPRPARVGIPTDRRRAAWGGHQASRRRRRGGVAGDPAGVERTSWPLTAIGPSIPLNQRSTTSSPCSRTLGRKVCRITQMWWLAPFAIHVTAVVCLAGAICWFFIDPTPPLDSESHHDR
jgi:hypothetical protein